MSTTGLGIDYIDPNLLAQATVNADGGTSLATTGTSLLNADVVDTEGANTDSSTVDTSGTEDITTDTSLLSKTSTDTQSTTDVSSTDIDVESVTPDFTLDDDWQSTNFSFSGSDSTWQENEDGTFTQSLSFDLGLGSDFVGGGGSTIKYNWSSDGDFLGLADGSEIAKTKEKEDADTEDDPSVVDLDLDKDDDPDFVPVNIGDVIDLEDEGLTAQGVDTTGDGKIDTYNVTDADGNITTLTSDEYSSTYGYDSESSINTEPITLDSGNFAYGFDSDGDGVVDTYRITDANGNEIETISADDFTGTGYVVGTETTTVTTVSSDDASTDTTYIEIVGNYGDDHVFITGSTDEDGDGIPDGLGVDGNLDPNLITAHTFADGSEGWVYTIDIPANEIMGSGQFKMYFNEFGQLVGSDGKGFEGMKWGIEGETKTKTKTDSDDDSDDDPEIDPADLDAWKTALTDILVNTGSDITDDFATLYGEIASLFGTGEDGALTEDDQQQLLAFFNNMITQGKDTGVILSSKTMADYFNLVKEYTGQYNGKISEADLETFLADWLAESVLFVSGLDNSQKWSLDNISDHSQYGNLQNLLELIYGEGRTLTSEEAMRYLTNYSWKSGDSWLYGVGGEDIANQELGITNFLVQQLVLNATGTDQEYVLSYWLSNDDLDLSKYGLTVEMIAEAWGMTSEQLAINTAKAKKDKNKTKSTGTFFAPKDVVRIGDEDPGSSPQTITGRGGRSKTKPKTLLGGSVMTSTLTGSN